MIRSVEAFVDEHGEVHLLEPIRIGTRCRAIVTILADLSPEDGAIAPARLSEASLAEDWNRPEEEAAWSHLQPG